MPRSKHWETRKHRVLRGHGPRNPEWGLREDSQREMRPELNSKAEQNELAKKVGKALRAGGPMWPSLVDTRMWTP